MCEQEVTINDLKLQFLSRPLGVASAVKFTFSVGSECENIYSSERTQTSGFHLSLQKPVGDTTDRTDRCYTVCVSTCLSLYSGIWCVATSSWIKLSLPTSSSGWRLEPCCSDSFLISEFFRICFVSNVTWRCDTGDTQRYRSLFTSALKVKVLHSQFSKHQKSKYSELILTTSLLIS